MNVWDIKIVHFIRATVTEHNGLWFKSCKTSIFVSSAIYKDNRLNLIMTTRSSYIQPTLRANFCFNVICQALYTQAILLNSVSSSTQQCYSHWIEELRKTPIFPKVLQLLKMELIASLVFIWASFHYPQTEMTMTPLKIVRKINEVMYVRVPWKICRMNPRLAFIGWRSYS